VPLATILPNSIAPGELHFWLRQVSALGQKKPRDWAIEVLSSYCPGVHLTVEPSIPSGKPVLCGAPLDLRFNLSHSGDWILLGVSLARELGVDIQLHRSLRYTSVEKLSRRFFAHAEWEALMSMPEDERLSGFYRLWVLKEAFVKAQGCGLSSGLKRFVVSLDGRLLSSESGGDWLIGVLPLSDNFYSAAYAVAKEGDNFCPKIIFK
jgi:phosphopantetheine--protein transferase-like protein